MLNKNILLTAAHFTAQGDESVKALIYVIKYWENSTAVFSILMALEYL